MGDKWKKRVVVGGGLTVGAWLVGGSTYLGLKVNKALQPRPVRQAVPVVKVTKQPININCDGISHIAFKDGKKRFVVEDACGTLKRVLKAKLTP